jgi:WD40 repeat protein
LLWRLQITSICFSPDGKTVAGGLIQGKVYFYDLVDFDQLKYKTQMNCRNAGGKYSAGTKVTGMTYRQLNSTYNPELDGAAPGQNSAYKWRRQTNNQRPASMQQAAQLLVSTNDSRLRLCRLDDYSVICKYKGLKNKSMQIKATFSQDGGHVICGSESGAVYIWNTLPKKQTTVSSLLSGKSNRNDGYECFDCTSGSDVATTVAIFAPVESVLTHLHHNTDVLATSGALSSSAASAQATSSANNSSPLRDSNPSGASAGASGQRPEALRVSVDYSSRVVVTADYEGSIRVFFRLS